MRRLPELLMLAVCVASAWIFSSLPECVVADVSWLLPFLPDAPAREGPRALLAFLIPITLLLLLIAYRRSTSASGRATAARILPAHLGTPAGHLPAYERFAGSLDLVILCVIALVSSTHFGLLASALRWDGPIALLVGVVHGLALACMGNVMPRLRPNPIAGLRTEAMLNDPTAWRNAHAVFGRTWVIGGAIVIAIALFASNYWLVAVLAVIVTSLVAAPIVSHRALARRGLFTPPS